MHKRLSLHLSILLYFLICPMDGLYSDKVKILDTFLLQSINPFSFKKRKKQLNWNKTCKQVIQSIFRCFQFYISCQTTFVKFQALSSCPRFPFPVWEKGEIHIKSRKTGYPALPNTERTLRSWKRSWPKSTFSQIPLLTANPACPLHSSSCSQSSPTNNMSA